jgi:preprotein translocase subunit SecE
MADTEKKPGFFARISRSFRDMKGELKKVVWPSKKQILNNTGVVLIALAISAIFIGGLDSILGLIVRFALGGN